MSDALLDKIQKRALIPDSGMSSRGWHRLETWINCKQAFAYRHILKLQPLQIKQALAIGSMFHLAEMHRQLALLGRPFKDARGHAVDPIEAMKSAPKRIAYTFAKAQPVFEAYRNRFGSEVLRVLDVEREFVIRVGGHLHTQRLDLVIQGSNEVLEAGNTRIFLASDSAYVWDHKTKSGDTKKGSHEWSASGQFNAGRLVGENVFPDLYQLKFGGTIINNVGTEPDEKGVYPATRHLLDYAEPHYLPIAQTIFETNEEIEATARSGRSPWAYTRSYKCQGRYGMCEYLPICEKGQAVVDTEFQVCQDEQTEIAQ